MDRDRPANGHLSRRRFLAAGGVAALGLAVGGCANDEATAPPSSFVSDERATDASPPVTGPRPTPTTMAVAPIDPTVVAMAYAGRAPSQWGTDVEGVDTRLVDAGAPGAPTLALTFDACGGRGGDEVDTELLDLLVAERLPATVFLNARWIDAHPTVTDRLLAEPQFEIANHGTRHVPLSVTGRAAYGITGTDSAAAAADEVWGNHQKLTALLGHSPRWFRSGTAHYDEVAAAIATDLGQQPVGFTVNGDLGATATKAQVQRAITGAPAGAVVLCHMNHPWKGTAVGLRAALPALRAKGTRFVTVTEGGGARA